MTLLRWISHHLVTSILIGMVAGYALGLLFDTSAMRSYVTLLSFFMVYPMMVPLNYASLKERGNIKLQVITQAVNFIYLPFLAYLFGVWFFPDALSYRLGLLLIALLPTSGMTVSWTVMAKGNVKEAIRMIVIGLILGGLLTPLLVNAYLGATIDLNFAQILSQIISIVFIPMTLGFFTQLILMRRYGAARFAKEIKSLFPPFSTLALVLLITLVMSLRARIIANNPTIILQLLIPLSLGYLVMMLSLHVLGKRLFNYEDRMAFMNGTMIRSLSVALAIALSVFESGVEISLIIALAYIIQVQLAAGYVKWNVRQIAIAQPQG